MRKTRVHVPAALDEGARIALPDAAARHVARVLRLRPGDPIAVFDGAGAEHAARIERASARGVEIVVGEPLVPIAETVLAVDLAQGISRGERMDLVVQKAVELGVRSITPLVTARSVVRLDARRAESRLAHWRAVAVGACEQCGRATVPEIRPILALDRWLAEADPSPLRLLLDPLATETPDTLAPAAHGVTLLVGPEGGLERAEAEAARRAGFVGVKLGPRVLRTETAALVAITAAQLLWGDLAGARASPG